MSFAEFLAWPDREEIILVELTPALVLSGWTAVGGGAPNSYQIACPALVGASQVPGGVFRRVVGLRENATALTERASLAACDANAGSWYWDAAAGLLYTRTSSGGDPDTFTVFSALVRFYLATTGVVLNATDGNADTGVYHQPWLVGEVPALVQEVEDVLFGVKNTAGGSVVATNAHGFWHTVIAPDGDYVWKNRTAAVFLGGRYRGQSLLRSEYEAVATMLVDEVVCDETQVTWALKPLARLTDQTIPPTPYFEASYPRMGEGVRGTRKWIGYGRAWIAPDLTDTKAHIWTIADADYQTLFRVHAVYAYPLSGGPPVNLTQGQDYSVDLTACTVTLLDETRYSSATHRLAVDVTGKPGGVRGYLSTFAEIVQDLLTVHMGVSVADIDTGGGFTAGQSAAPQELALWIKEPRTIASVLGTREDGFPSLEVSVHGTVLATVAGQWTMRVWQPTYDASGLVSLRKEDLALFRPEPKFESVYTTTRVHFGYDHSEAAWGVESSSDTRRQHLTGSRDRQDLYTYLRSAGDAAVLAARYQFVVSHAQLAVAFEERGALLAAAQAGDRVFVTHSPAPVAAGAFSSRLCEVTRLERRFSPMFRVSGLIEDLDGLDNLPRNVGQWVAGGSPDWATATAEEREASGFWCDANGRTDPGDATTEGKSRWW